MRGRVITSTIEVITEEEGMNGRHKKRHKYRSKHSSDDKGKSEEFSNSEASEDSEASGKKKATRYQSTAKASKNGFFHGVEAKQGNITQNTNVSVKIEQADDGIAECLSGCFSACLGLGKKAAE